MNSVLNFKNVKMAVALALMILLVVALIPAPVQAAEVTWYRGEPGYSVENKAKIGDGYFWYEYEYTEDSTITVLRYSATKSGKGVKLASMEYPYYYGETILFNGTKVYYSTHDYDRGDESSKFRIHSVSKTGKNKVTLRTLTVKDSCGFTELLSVYNGKVYFSRFDKDWEENKTTGKLCTINMKKDTKTGKYLVSTVNKDFPCAESGGANSRYIYGKAGNGEYYSTSGTLKIYDCKEKKVVRTVKNVTKFACTSGKLYYAQNGGEYTPTKSIYSASTSGLNKKLIVKLSESQGFGNLFSKYLYYWDQNSMVHYKYNLAKGTTEEIDQMQFMFEALGPMGM